MYISIKRTKRCAKPKRTDADLPPLHPLRVVRVDGAFEAGFKEDQKKIILGWGCTEDNVASTYDSEGGSDLGKRILVFGQNVVLCEVRVIKSARLRLRG
jgi:hypothetical protein